MYYIGEISHDPNGVRKPIIELWDDHSYSNLSQAKTKIEEIKVKYRRDGLEVIDDRIYDVAGSQHWE